MRNATRGGNIEVVVELSIERKLIYTRLKLAQNAKTSFYLIIPVIEHVYCVLALK